MRQVRSADLGARRLRYLVNSIMSLQPLFDEDAPAWFTIAGPEAYSPKRPLGTIRGRIAFGVPIFGRPAEPALPPSLRSPASVTSLRAAATGPTVHQSFPHPQLGRASARLRILSQAAPTAAIRPRRTVRLSAQLQNNHI
jgi:hypothetical protein